MGLFTHDIKKSKVPLTKMVWKTLRVNAPLKIKRSAFCVSEELSLWKRNKYIAGWYALIIVEIIFKKYTISSTLQHSMCGDTI